MSQIRPTILGAGKAVAQIEFSYIADRSINWRTHFGKLFGKTYFEMHQKTGWIDRGMDMC